MLDILTTEDISLYNSAVPKIAPARYMKRYPLTYSSGNRTRFWFIFPVIVLSILSTFISSAAVLADEPLAIASTQPEEVLEDEDYSWQIGITGGTPPYSCNLTGTLPPGLVFNATSLNIHGKVPKGTDFASYTFTITATDSSSPPLSVESPCSINVKYRSNISISPALPGETNVYADGQYVAKVRGGEHTSVVFEAGTQHTISVEPSVLVASNGDIRSKPVTDRIVVSGLSPDAVFDYSSEYEIHVQSNQSDIPALPGSGWYSINDLLESTAPVQIEPRAGTQYRFVHWLLPAGEVLGDAKLNWKVTRSGDATAVYDIYYKLTVNSEYCDVEGEDWYRAGSKARWKVECSEPVPAPGFWGNLGIELKARPGSGAVLVDSPKEINVLWKADYSRIVIPVITGIIVTSVLAIIRMLRDRSKKVVARIKEKRTPHQQ